MFVVTFRSSTLESTWVAKDSIRLWGTWKTTSHTRIK